MSAAPADAFTRRIRAMTYADLDDVLGIEKRAYGFPWPETIFRDCIRVGYRCCVLEGGAWLEAYGLMSIGAGEAHVLNLCVRPESQGRGFAKLLLAHLLADARASDVRSVFLEVRPSNSRAIRLYQRMGFAEVAVRPEYYPGERRREDALVMAKEL